MTRFIMIKQNEIHNKIFNILEEKGPSLPIQISKQIGMGSLFISAFLSELIDEKRIKVSDLKVGGSPLYFIEGQEEKLENFYKFLHPKEAEAFLLLKKKKVLKDSEQEPAIRVALRSIKDFSVGFKKNNEIYWKSILIPEKEINKLLQKPVKQIKKQTTQPPIKPTPPKVQPTKQPTKKTEKTEFQNPLAVLKKIKPKKQKQKSEFVQRIINLLNNKLQVIEEKDYKAKEYNCLIKANSDLGPIIFLTQAKDKKSVSETDLKKLLSNAQSIPLPALFIYTGKLSKKAQEYGKKYLSILKILKVS